MEHAVDQLQPVVIIMLAGILGATLMKLCRLTPILGFFIAGVLINPSALGLIEQNELIILLAEIGVALLLFDIGLHLSFKQIWRMRNDILILGMLQMLVCSLAIGFCAYLLEYSFEASVVIGSGLALSSTAIVMQLINEKGLSKTQFGQTTTSILIFQDISMVFLLILIPVLGGKSEISLLQASGLALIESIAAFIAVFLVGKYVFKPVLALVLDKAKDELFTAVVLLIVILTAGFTAFIGLSLALGAFLAGLVISETHYCYLVKDEMKPFRTLLLGVFFISAGLTQDIVFLANNWLTVLLIVLAFMLLKVLVFAPIVWFKKKSLDCSIAISLWLSQAGEFGFVLFSLAYSQNILDLKTYQTLMVSIGISFLLTPVMIQLSEVFLRNKKSTSLESAAS